MKNLIKSFTQFILLFLVIPFFLGSVQAASLKFDKTTVSASNGGTFQVAVTVEPGSDALNSTDVYVSFDSTLLKATSVTAGSLFPTVTNDISTAGKVYIAGMVNDPANSISTTGTLATITFQGLKEGTGTLTFDCNTSKIIKNDLNATNVLSCSTNNSCAVTIGSGGTAPTATPGADGGNNIEELPQSGVFENLIKFAVPGFILVMFGTIMKLVLK